MSEAPFQRPTREDAEWVRREIAKLEPRPRIKGEMLALTEAIGLHLDEIRRDVDALRHELETLRREVDASRKLDQIAERLDKIEAQPRSGLRAV
jgi:hypothetical protein